MTSKSSKFCALLICIPCLAGSLAAQSMAKRQLVLPLSDGGFVAFRSETSASDNNQLLALMQNYNGARIIKQTDDAVQLFFENGSANLEAVNRFCFEKGIVLKHLRLKKKSLETKFFELTNTSEADN